MARAYSSTVLNKQYSSSIPDTNSNPESNSTHMNSTPSMMSEETPNQKEYFEMKKKGIVDILGNASDGRSVMVILPCKIPNDERSYFDYNMLRSYATSLLDAHKDIDYYVLYFHCDSVSETDTTKQWMRDLFHTVQGEKHESSHKNVHRLFIVHPTAFIRTVWYLTVPLLFWKFKQKIHYVNTLRQLKKELPYDELVFRLPIHVLEQDKMIEDRCRSNLQDEVKHKTLVPDTVMDAVMRLKKPHDGIRENHHPEKDSGVPFALKTCVDYLSDPSILSKEDLFSSSNYNISGSHRVMEALKRGVDPELDDYKDPCMAAAVLKQFFREMPEPLFTYDLYDDAVAFNNARNKMAAAKTLVLYRLPKSHFRTLAFFLAFLLRVLDFRDANKSSAKKLAVIFAPLLMRPKENHASLAESTIEMYDTAEFLKFLLENFLAVFTF